MMSKKTLQLTTVLFFLGISFASLASKKEVIQIGNEWGKKIVTQEAMNRSSVLTRAAKSTAKIELFVGRFPRGRGTAVYLGKYAGTHVMATNAHICSPAKACINSRITLPFMPINFSWRIKDVIGRWEQIDLSLITFKPRDQKEEDTLAEIALPFSYEAPVYKNQELLTTGFGARQNPRSRMVYNRDEDCRVFSDQFRYLEEVDGDNDYQTWSMAIGCDISVGDSGSPVLDRHSGELLGLIWSTKYGKIDSMQNPTFLENLLNNPGAETWEQMTYAIPVKKIREVLKKELRRSNSIAEKNKKIIRELIQKH